MRALRPVLATTCCLALLGGVGVTVLAQDESEQVTPVTGTTACQVTDQGRMVYRYDGVDRYRDHISTCQPDLSDPRVNGPYEMVWESDCYPDGRCMMWATHQTIGDGPDGWTGRYVGWVEASGATIAVGYFEGYGAYDGLTVVIGGEGDLSGTTAVDGLIYEGIPPQLPGLSTE